MEVHREQIDKLSENTRLLRALAEQLKIPLLQIARQTELPKTTEYMLQDVNEQASMALRLLDGYLLSTQQISRGDLELQPTTVSSVLYDAAHNLAGIAKQYSCDLELETPYKLQPVLVHRESFEAAILALGYSFIEAQATQDDNQKKVITLAAHRSRYGVAAGVYGRQEGLSTDMYRRARSLYGRARQPLPSLTSTSGAGIFLADSLLEVMNTRLHVSHHHKLNGLAAILLSSRQLSLI